jgi:hypothetical protein
VVDSARTLFDDVVNDLIIASGGQIDCVGNQRRRPVLDAVITDDVAQCVALNLMPKALLVRDVAVGENEAG